MRLAPPYDGRSRTCCHLETNIELTISETKLNARTADGALASVFGALRPGEVVPHMRIGLGQVQFIDPYGMCCLWTALHHLRARATDLSLDLPMNPDVQNYMERIGFLALIERDGTRLTNDLTMRSEHPSDSDVLLEMTAISGEGDVRLVAARILDRVERIIHAQLSYSPQGVASITTTLTETCRNVTDHSESVGVACAQSYTNVQRERFVVIAVADDGIGIRSSLATRYPEAPSWTHGEAIELALKKTCSRLPDRGLGLYQITQIVNRHRGSLHIRSGDTHLLLRDRPVCFTGGYFPGTQLCITLTAHT